MRACANVPHLQERKRSRGRKCIGNTAVEVTVYIVRCSDGSYYTGLTKQEIEARVWEHNEGVYDGYTKKRRPVTLVFTETYDRIIDAIARERQIKGWSRAKKEALIAMNYEALPDLAKNRQGVIYKRRGLFAQEE